MKPRLRLVDGEFVPVGDSPIERARVRYGRPFDTAGKTTKGAAFWTPERIAELAATNRAARRSAGRGVA